MTHYPYADGIVALVGMQSDYGYNVKYERKVLFMDMELSENEINTKLVEAWIVNSKNQVLLLEVNNMWECPVHVKVPSNSDGLEVAQKTIEKR